MSYLEIGFFIGFSLSHAAAFTAGLWLRDKYWQKVRERAGV